MSQNSMVRTMMNAVSVSSVLLAVLLCSISNICQAQKTCPAQPTRWDSKGPFYVAGAPETNRLAPEEQLMDPANMLLVKGTVLGNDCVPLANVRVEAWYAGEPDEFGFLYSPAGSDLKYRGQVISDECGFYNFTQTFPEVYGSRPLHVHFRISSIDTNEEMLVTQMYFEGFADTVSGRDLQVVAIDTSEDGSRSVVFDIFVDRAGTADIQVCSNETVTNNGTLPQNLDPKLYGNASDVTIALASGHASFGVRLTWSIPIAMTPLFIALLV